MEEFRKAFPLIGSSGQVYFDNAATTHKPQCVIDAITNFYAEENGTVNRAVYKLSARATAKCHAVREAVAQFIGAKSSDEIIFTKGTTDALNLVAESLGRSVLKVGDEVCITAMEHHANIVPWQRLRDERGITLRVLPINERGELLPFEFSDKTKVVALTHVSNSLGTVNDIKVITEEAHRVGALVVVDAAQSAGHMPLDMQALDVDLLAFSGHKMYGPTGIGALYGKKEVLEKMAPYQLGGDMIERVTFEESTYQKPPLKFEAGTPNIAGIIGLGVAIDFIERYGREVLHTYEMELYSYALERLENVRLIGEAKKHGPLITFAIEGAHPLDIGTLLDMKGVAVRTGHLCAQPVLAQFNLEHATRISFAPYNTKEEIDRFIEALKAVKSLVLPTA